MILKELFVFALFETQR